MLEMASLGAKVMQPTSLQDARLNRIDVDVKSSFINKQGTLITKKKNVYSSKVIRGISVTKNDAKVTLVGVKDKPGVAASIFKPISQNSINVDMVVQNISANGKETDLTFTIKSEDLPKTQKLIKKNKKIIFRNLIVDKEVSKVSIIGVGVIATPEVTHRMFQTLAEKNINVNAISGGYIETGAFDSFPNRESMASAGKKTLAGRKMSVDDIATVAAFLCSADAHMIRGQILVVDGGVTLSANL